MLQERRSEKRSAARLSGDEDSPFLLLFLLLLRVRAEAFGACARAASERGAARGDPRVYKRRSFSVRHSEPRSQDPPARSRSRSRSARDRESQEPTACFLPAESFPAFGLCSGSEQMPWF